MTTSMSIGGTAAEIYEQHMVPAIFAQWSTALVETAGVRPGQRVLDVACGTGSATRAMAERVGAAGHVVGLDFSPAMLAVARAVTPHGNVAWREADAAHMPLPDGSFDVVVCQQGLQFMPDMPGALREMRRVLGPGGRLAITVWRSVAHAPHWRLLEEALGRRIGKAQAALPPFTLGEARAVRAMLEAAEFRDVRVWAEVRLSRFRSAEHFVRAAVSGAPTMLGALAEQGPEVLDEIVQEVGALSGDFVDDKWWAGPQVSNVFTAMG